MKKIEFYAMGCQMSALLDPLASPAETARFDQAIQALEAVPEWFEEWEQCLSRFRIDSELSRLNASAGIPTPVSPTMYQVIKLALRTARKSGGLVVPNVLTALETAGYDRSFEALQSSPSNPFLVMAPRRLDDWREIVLDARTRSVWIPQGVRIDLGGVAKGWAAHQAMQRLARFGPALVDASGDIAISAPMLNGHPWPIGVDSPFETEVLLAMVAIGAHGGLEGGGVATSGRDFRRWQKNGVWQHHIIDPRTGLSADTDVLTATVIAPDVMQAEMAAKVILIRGSKEGLAWLDSRQELAGLITLPEGQVLHSQRMKEYMY